MLNFSPVLYKLKSVIHAEQLVCERESTREKRFHFLHMLIYYTQYSKHVEDTHSCKTEKFNFTLLDKFLKSNGKRGKKNGCDRGEKEEKAKGRNEIQFI